MSIPRPLRALLRLLPLLLVVGLLPAATTRSVQLADLRLSVPEDWAPLPSPSSSLLRWDLDPATAPVALSGAPVDEAWLAAASAHPRVALAALPTTEADHGAAAQALRERLLASARSPRVAIGESLRLGDLEWSEMSHSWSFGGVRVHQVTWIAVHAGIAYACSYSSGGPPAAERLAALRLQLATASLVP